MNSPVGLISKTIFPKVWYFNDLIIDVNLMMFQYKNLLTFRKLIFKKLMTNTIFFSRTLSGVLKLFSNFYILLYNLTLCLEK